MRRRLVFCLPWLFFLLGFAGQLARAAPIDFAAPLKQLPLAGQVAILEDKNAALSPMAALDESRWQTATPRLMNQGTSDAAFWLRLAVTNTGPTPVTRWLSLGSPRIEAVDFYQMKPGEEKTQPDGRGGAYLPLSEKPVAGKIALFPVTLAAGEEATLLLRAAGRTTIAMDIALWDPLVFREQEASNDLHQLIPIAALMTVAFYLLVHALARRDRVFLLLAGWLFGAALYELAFNGYLLRYLLTGGGELTLRAPLLIGNLSVVLTVALIYVFLELGRFRIWRWFYLSFIAVSLGGFLLSMFASLRPTIGLWHGIVMVFYLIWPLSMVVAWRHRLPNTRLFIVFMTGLWCGHIVRMLMLQGAIPATPLINENLSVIFALGMALVLLFGVARQSMAAQQAKVQLQQAEQARLEEAVRTRTDALQAALIVANEANRAKSDFLARVSHDLRTPLTAIIGYAEIILSAGRQDAGSGRIIRRSAQHLLALLNDLIDYARGGAQPTALQPLPVYTAALLESIASDGAILAQRQGNRFDFRVSGTLPPIVEVDAKRLRQVLENLISNAAKFTANGLIEFHVTAQEDAAEPESGRIDFIFSVRDTGPGIPAAGLVHIFEPFQRLQGTEHHAGLGLGLAIAQQWVQRMGGRIEAISRVGDGTTMRVFLGIKAGSEDAMSHQNRAINEGLLPELDGDGYRIWVVEDSHTIRGMLCDALGRLGFAVLPIANGQEAIDLINQIKVEAPDLILTDLQMPFADGQAVLNKAREKWPDIPVLLLTANHDRAGEGEQAFSDVLSKPVSLTLLHQVLAKWLGLPCTVEESVVWTPPLVYPDPEVLAEVFPLIDMGAISDLIDWAEGVAQRQAAWRPFAERVKSLADQVQLKALATLCREAQSDIIRNRGAAYPSDE